jgi:nucleoside-diphosphate-sugar epimerase
MSDVVLVTGSAGRIGQAVVQELQARGRPVRGFDRIATPGLKEYEIADLLDTDALRRACSGAAALIHLAATPDDADFKTDLLPNNIVGVYNVMEAARAAGVGRLVLASSGQVVWWQRFTGPWPIRVDAVPTPRAWYACCKMFMEGAGRAYAEDHKGSVVVARLGWCPRNRAHVEELAQTPWGPDVYLSPGDAGRFFACAVEAPLQGFVLVYACSKPVQREQYDRETARHLLGFEPHDRWPEGLPNF